MKIIESYSIYALRTLEILVLTHTGSYFIIIHNIYCGPEAILWFNKTQPQFGHTYYFG